MPHKKGHSWGDLGSSIKNTAGNLTNKIKNKGKLLIKKYNPASEENKKIRDKQKIIDNEESSRQETNVAKAQRNTVKRLRDGKTISDVHAKNKADMQSNAKKKHADWKKMRSGKMKKEDFIKKYPNSGTARKARGNR